MQNILKAAAKLDIQMICPLHGPVLSENLEHYLHLYDLWSSYTPETEGVVIAYSSVYGHTRKAVFMLEEALKKQGVQVVVHDLARCDMSLAVSDAFRYDRLILATTTYNGDIFPAMRSYLEQLAERNFQKRKVALIENGTWAPMANKLMMKYLEECKELTFAQSQITINSAVNKENAASIEALAQEMAH